MAKSLRSKAKRSFRSKKRESGIYAATAAARLERLNSKLLETARKDAQGDVSLEGDEEDVPADRAGPDAQPDAMTVDSEKAERISTHGPRNSRREEWRKSKGMPIRPSLGSMNRQGGLAARRKAGRSKRRR